MPGLTSASQSAQAILAKQRDLVAQYTAHRGQITQLQQRAFEELVPAICDDNAEDGEDTFENDAQTDQVGAGSSSKPALGEHDHPSSREDSEARIVAFLEDDGEGIGLGFLNL